MDDVTRLDFGGWSKVVRTPSGGLRIPASLTRVGVFNYRTPDGKIRRELRPPQEVFKADSLDTLKSAPVTDLHPKTMVKADNWRDLSIGHVSESVKQDGNFVASDLLIQDQDSIDAIERKDRKELSCGYTCQLDFTPGVFNGERYDAIQRKIRYNHVALGPKGWGRAGGDVSLRLDAADAIQVPADTPPTKTEVQMKTVRIDGVDYEAGSPQHLQAVERRDAAQLETIATLTAERDELQGKFDAADAAKTDLQTKLDSALDPASLDTLVAARVALHGQARKVLGAEAKFDGKEDRDVMIEVIKHDNADFDAAEKSDDYIRGRFESVASSAKRHDEGGRGVAAMRTAATPAPRTDAGDVNRFDAASARQRMIEANRKAAEAPLCRSK